MSGTSHRLWPCFTDYAIIAWVCTVCVDCDAQAQSMTLGVLKFWLSFIWGWLLNFPDPECLEKAYFRKNIWKERDFPGWLEAYQESFPDGRAKGLKQFKAAR